MNIRGYPGTFWNALLLLWVINLCALIPCAHGADSVLETDEVQRIDLGFSAREFVVSMSGHYLVAWGVEDPDNGFPKQPRPDKVAVVDVRKRRVITEKVLPTGVQSAAVDDKHVFVATQAGNLLYRFNHELEDSQRTFLSATPKMLLRVGVDKLLVSMGSDKPTVFYSCDSLKPDPDPTPPIIERSPVLSTSNEVFYRGRFVDRKSWETIALIIPQGVPMLNRPSGEHSMLYRYPITRFGRMLDGKTLSHKKTRLGELSKYETTLIAERHPLAVLIDYERGVGTTTTKLDLANLIDGSVITSKTLDVCPEKVYSSLYWTGSLNKLHEVEDTFFILRGNLVLMTKLPAEAISKAPVPPHFLRQRMRELDFDKEAEIALAVNMEANGLDFSLGGSTPGLSIDATRGVLKIDTPAMWKTFLAETLADPLLLQRQSTNKMARTENAALYKEITGKELPEGLMVAAIPISAVLRDSEGQSDSTHFCVLVVGPRKEIDEGIAEAEAKPVDTTPQRTKDIDQRLRELEGRLQRIEDSLNKVIERLDEKEK